MDKRVDVGNPLRVSAAPSDRTDHHLRSVALGILTARVASGVHRYQNVDRISADERAAILDAVEMLRSAVDSSAEAQPAGHQLSYSLAGYTLQAFDEKPHIKDDEPEESDTEVIEFVVDCLNKIASRTAVENDSLALLETAFRKTSDIIAKQNRSNGETLNVGRTVAA